MKRSLTIIASALAGVSAGVLAALTFVSPPVADSAEPDPTTTSSTTSSSSTTTSSSTSTTTSTTVAPVEAEPRTLRPGATGERVLALQRRLRDLGYWLGQPDGTYGYLTSQAVLAFQKVNGLERDGLAGPGTLAALEAAGQPTGRTTSGDLVEIDKERQVMLVVRDGEVVRVVNVSTGTERPYTVNGRTELADTPPGRWTVSWAVDGTDFGELGGLYRPRYFHADGIAVHGYHDVPAYPASHGCVRVAHAVMDWIWSSNVLPLGSPVWVY